MIAFFIFLMIGAVAGFLAGLLGIGGGLVVVPSLLVAFRFLGITNHMPMQLAVGTSLAVMVISTFSAALSHYKRKSIDVLSALVLGIGNIGGAWCGGYLTGIFPSQWLQIGFGSFQCVVAMWFAFSRTLHTPSHQKSRWPLVCLGLIVGLISTLLGIGGGLIQVPLLIYFGLPLRKAIGTASCLSFVIALTGSLTLAFPTHEPIIFPHSLGFIYLPAFFAIGSTSFLTAPLGAKLVHSASPNKLRKVVGLFLFAVGLGMILSAALNKVEPDQKAKKKDSMVCAARFRR